MNHTSWAKKADAKMERLVLEQADDVIVVSEAIQKMFVSKSERVNESKIHVIPNGFDEDDFVKPDTSENKEFVITYTGTLSGEYDTKAFIQGLKQVNKDNIKIRLVGRIADEVLDQLKSFNVEVIGHVEHSQSIQYLMNTDVLLLIIPRIENNEGILTGKLFEYLAARKPIIAIGPRNGNAASIIKECGAGKMFNYDDVRGVTTYLSALEKGEWTIDLNNENYKNYSRKKLTSKLVKLIE